MSRVREKQKKVVVMGLDDENHEGDGLGVNLARELQNEKFPPAVQIEATGDLTTVTSRDDIAKLILVASGDDCSELREKSQELPPTIILSLDSQMENPKWLVISEIYKTLREMAS